MLPTTSSNTGAQTPTIAQTPTKGQAPAIAQAPMAEQARAMKREETIEEMSGSEEILGFVDWITCTFPVETNIKDLKSFLGGAWEVAEGGSNGYKEGQRCGGMSIWYAGGKRRGMCLQVTGDGCRDLEVEIIQSGWRCFLGELLKRNAKFSRLDVALDDRIGILDFSELDRCCRTGMLTSRFDKHQHIDTAMTGTTKIAQSSIVFGSPVSDSRLKIYDKAMEQSKEGHHVRVELQIRRRNAQAVVQSIVDDGEEVIAGFIAGIVEFKAAGNDPRKWRLKTLPAWKRFTSNATKIRFSTAPSEPSLKKSIKSLEKQYGPTMAMITMACGPDKLLQIAREAENRLTDKHRRMVKHYLAAA